MAWLGIGASITGPALLITWLGRWAPQRNRRGWGAIRRLSSGKYQASYFPGVFVSYCPDGAATCAQQKVLEVSCGHGGGASYLMRTLYPASYTGLDFNADGIAFCQRRHRLPGLDVVPGH